MRLFEELHERGIYATGTLRADRKGFPEDLKESVKKGLKERGECKICQSKLDTNLSVCVWQAQKLSQLALPSARPLLFLRYKER